MGIGRLVGCLVLGVLLGAVEATGMTFLPLPWREIHPVLPVIVLFVVREEPVVAAILAGTAGAVFDVFAIDGGSFAFGRLLAIVLLVRFVSRSVLTNQSQYTAISLAVMARLADRAWVVLFHLVTRGGSVWQEIAWPSLWRSCLWDVAIIGSLFFLIVSYRRRFVSTASGSLAPLRRI